MFESIKEFRAKATQEDCQNLLNFIQSQPKKVKAFPNETYNFSYSAAMEYLKKEGFIEDKNDIPDTKKTEEFLIRPGQQGPQKDFVDRSFSIPKSILLRLDNLCSDNWQYTRKAIFAKLLDDALRHYGY